MKRIFINLKYINKNALLYVSLFFTFLSTIGLFIPINTYFADDMKIFSKILFCFLFLLCTWGLCFLLSCLYVLSKSRIKIMDVGNNHYVYVQYGDIFSSELISEKYLRRNVVIPVNRCFDTKVDDNLISKNTLHGISFTKLCKNGIYTQEELSEKIKKCLDKKIIKN